MTSRPSGRIARFLVARTPHGDRGEHTRLGVCKLATDHLNLSHLPAHVLVLAKIKDLRKALQTTKLKKACMAAAEFREWLQKKAQLQLLHDDYKGQFERHGTVTPRIPLSFPGWPSGTLDVLSDLLIELVQLEIKQKPGFKDKALELTGEFQKLSGVSEKKSAKRRRQATVRKPTPLTAKQTEAMQLVGEHKGNLTAAGKAAGKTRQAVKKLYDKALAS